MPSYHLLIKGKVQGVFYRASAKKAAASFSINGWVRNRSNGDVEALASGTTEQLNKFIDWCRKGTANAIVTDVIITEQAETEFESFSVKH